MAILRIELRLHREKRCVFAVNDLKVVYQFLYMNVCSREIIEHAPAALGCLLQKEKKKGYLPSPPCGQNTLF